MELMDIIRARRSIRKYAPKPVSREVIEEVLEAGRLAPSARNLQLWRFIAVTDAGVRAKMLPACGSQPMVGEAPVILVLCANSNRAMSNEQLADTVDCSIAASFMMLRAQELGLGTCWLGHYSNEDVKKVLSIPDDYNVVAVLPMGYPAETPDARPRKALAEVASFDKF